MGPLRAKHFDELNDFLMINFGEIELSLIIRVEFEQSVDSRGPDVRVLDVNVRSGLRSQRDRSKTLS